jgi:hypothetical protein
MNPTCQSLPWLGHFCEASSNSKSYIWQDTARELLTNSQHPLAATPPLSEVWNGTRPQRCQVTHDEDIHCNAHPLQQSRIRIVLVAGASVMLHVSLAALACMQHWHWCSGPGVQAASLQACTAHSPPARPPSAIAMHYNTDGCLPASIPTHARCLEPSCNARPVLIVPHTSWRTS